MPQTIHNCLYKRIVISIHGIPGGVMVSGLSPSALECGFLKALVGSNKKL